jgi:hypothetical protein
MTTSDDSSAMPFDANTGDPEVYSERPWIELTTTHDVEAWIDNYNRDLQQAVKKPNATGYGVRFSLDLGGHIFMHTAEGAILLDVTPEAEWAAPVITAATGIEAPRSQIWVLPDDKLTQLVLGLSSLIASTAFVVSHNYKVRRY